MTNLMQEIVQVLDSRDFEVIWVDDASTDGTIDELAEFTQRFPQARVIRLSARGGQSLALWKGLQNARGYKMVTLDGDGQNDPKDMLRLLDELRDFEFVIGWRKQRMDRLSKRLFSCFANFSRNLITRSQIPDSGCALRAFHRDVISDLIPFHGLHRFLPTLAEIAGRRVRVIEVNCRPRERGKSKYGVFDRLCIPLLDCLMLAWLKIRRLP